MSDLNLSRFTKIARGQCCNFSDIGPRRIRLYCCIEPRDSEKQCRIFHNIHCLWFEQAVLPVNATMMHEWKRIFQPEELVSPAAWVKSARCECGKLFRSRSNRQERCFECAVKDRRVKARARKQKQREHQRQGVAL